MYKDWFYLQQDRMLRERELAERMDERRRLAELKACRPSPRARMARYLFALAVAAEREETWKIVWERLESRGRL
jgi:hypothetical protein